MKRLRPLMALAVVCVLFIAPDTSAGCRYRDCYVNETGTYAQCVVMPCGGGQECGKYAETCIARCDVGCWCNYSFCFDI